MSRHTKKPDDLLNKAQGPLKQLYRQAQKLLAIEQTVKSAIKGPVKVAAFEHQILTLATPSAALTTRIKYSQNSLIAELARLNPPIRVKSITVEVRPELLNLNPTKDPAFTAKPPSSERGEEIAKAAKYIEDEALSKALIRLASNAEQPD